MPKAKPKIDPGPYIRTHTHENRSAEWHREAACHVSSKPVQQQLRENPDIAENMRRKRPFKFF